MNLQDRIQAGLEGKYVGLSNGFQRINDYIFGIQRGTYYLLGGQSGTFKSMITDFMIMNGIQDAESKQIPLNIFYYSYEIDELTKKCNWLSSLIFQKHNIEVSPEKIKGLGSFRLSDAEQQIVNQEIPYVQQVFSKINFRFVPTNPTGIYHELFKFGESKGEIHYEEYTNGDGVPKKKIIGFTPHNPDEYTVVILDHLYNLQKERGFLTKEVIDKYSEYCVHLRNLFGFSFLSIQQFNDGLSSVERAKYKGLDLSPQQTDFKDTRNPYTDADVVLGTMCPFKLDMEECLGYNINKLKEKFVMLKVIKNRLSKDNIAIGLYVNPKSGTFKELPPLNQIKYEDFS